MTRSDPTVTRISDRFAHHLPTTGDVSQVGITSPTGGVLTPNDTVETNDKALVSKGLGGSIRQQLETGDNAPP